MTRLSVLDPTPIRAGQSAAEALGETRQLAVATDQLGYDRYWVQEHHNTASFAGTAPEILISDLASRTQTIRIGSGGVMLPNYSPLKVAEQFLTLSALYPGRIDLGIGRATGADPRTSAALLGPGAKTFPTMFQMLKDWLLDASDTVPLSQDHRAFGIRARPSAAPPDLWLLASSSESAAFAGAVGAKLAFAEFLSPHGAADALDAYRAHFSPSPFTAAPHTAIATLTLAADTAAEAEAEGQVAMAWNVRRSQGQFAPFPSPDEAAAILDQTSAAQKAALAQRTLIGDATDIAGSLRAHSQDIGADEIFVLTVTSTVPARIRSYQRLKSAWDHT